MVHRKSLGIAERETLIVQAVLDVQSGKYKSAYHAEKVLGLPKSSVTRRVNGGLTRSQARQQQQNLSGVQEKILLKWIKNPNNQRLFSRASVVKGNSRRTPVASVTQFRRRDT